MRYIIMPALVVILCGRAKAQITLTQSSYPASLIGTDSLKKTTYNSSFPSLPADTAALWDLSSVTDTTPVFFAYRVASSHQFADSNIFPLGLFSYTGDIQSDITSSAYAESGVYIFDTGYSLSGLTGGGPSDTLIIPSQTVSYSSPKIKIAFPATYNSSWWSSDSANYNFQITLSAFGWSNAPGIVRRNTVELDTVTGWGKLRVKNNVGATSLYFDVLQIKSITITTDNFFVNGSLVPSFELTLLGLSQGQHDTTYQQNYYRPWEVTPLAQVNFRDAAFTQPVSATTHAQRLMDNGLAGVADEQSVKLYPNPACNSISVELSGEKGEWNYCLTDIAGRQLTTGTINYNSNRAIIPLPSSLGAGVYQLTLQNSSGYHYTRQLQVR